MYKESDFTEQRSSLRDGRRVKEILPSHFMRCVQASPNKASMRNVSAPSSTSIVVSSCSIMHESCMVGAVRQNPALDMNSSQNSISAPSNIRDMLMVFNVSAFVLVDAARVSGDVANGGKRTSHTLATAGAKRLL